jgi:hypothetical protein
MIRYECDKCGERMVANDPKRFIVRLEVYAAAGPVELELDRNHDVASELTAVLNSLRAADADELEDQTYRAFRFDVCDACRRTLLAQPLG